MFALRTFAPSRVLGTLAFTLIALTLIGAGTATAACPNEALRQRQSATFLPDCRAYEMASPPAKNGGAVSELRWQAAPSGEAVAFISKSAFPGASSAPLTGNYLALRQTSGWATDQIDLPQLNSRGFIQGVTLANSEDLQHSLQVSRLALAPGAIEEGSNIYLVDNFSGERTLVVAREGEDLFQEMATEPTGVFAGATADWSHVAFRSSKVLTDGAVEEVPNLYEFTGGELRLVSLLPNGESWPFGVGAGREGPFPARQHVVSADGSRIFFKAIADPGGGGGVYLREGGTETVLISKSQKAGASDEPRAADFAAASSDGSIVYFLSNTNLTDVSDTHERPSLYRYEVETETLTDLTIAPTAPEGADVGALFGISDDGSYAYFSARAALAPGATEGPHTPHGAMNVYAWHDGQIRYIAQTSPENEELSGPAERYVSPNGLYLGLGTLSPLNDEDVSSPSCVEGEGRGAGMCRDVYRYDYAADELTCVSCDGVPAGDSDLAGDMTSDRPGASSRRVLDDGTLFFNTPNSLAARDSNGQLDAYMWREGQRSLLSTGTGGGPSTFGDATPDGSSVFIRTSQRLVSRDVDSNYDLYAVRVNGGLEAQNEPPPPAPCAGEGCRNAGNADATEPDPATLNLHADGMRPGSRCAALAAKAKKARARARTLRARARDGGGKARRRQAKRAGRTAKKLTMKATNCGGQA